ncbi:MAG: P1 family peptidase [Gemmatimonadales bacterium]
MFLLVAAAAAAQPVPRARERDLSLPISGTAGRLDAITDVAGVEVGFTTLIEGEGKLEVGKGPVRTGVTVIFPRGKDNLDPVFANWYSYNGNGEMTGTTWITEGGFLEGPIGITNTHSVGTVRDAIIAWETRGGRRLVQPWQLPVAAETYDGGQNDINGFHVKPEHVFAALDGAKGGVVPAEGNVGGGTGMTCFGFKGSTGTASRRIPDAQGGYTVGVMVQCNTGQRGLLRIGGVPVGRELTDTLLGCVASNDPTIAARFARRCPGFELPGEQQHALPFGGSLADGVMEEGQGSMIVVVATDAPLLPHQIERLLKRLPGGLAREGNVAGNGDGDIFIGFSTANARAAQDTTPSARFVSNARIAPLFEATAQALEAAITNGLLAGETMTGSDYRRTYALPVERLKGIFAKYGQPLTPP